MNPYVPKIILENQFYGWRWNLPSIWTTAGSETVTKTSTLEPKKSSKKPNSTVDGDIFYANKLLLTDKPLMNSESLVSQKSS